MIASNVAELNQFLELELREPIGFGIGMHAGEVIIGDIGYRDHRVFTALGDAVNVASRLQDMTKTLRCAAVISEEVMSTAGLATDAVPPRQVAIRGRSEPMTVRAFGDARPVGPVGRRRKND
jgi:adenylate cyclase